MTATDRAFTYRCRAEPSRSQRGTPVQCTRRVSGFGADLELAAQDARDRATLAGWAPAHGARWSDADTAGLVCPRHG